MTEERKIGAGGLAALLIMSRLFTEVTCLAGDGVQYGMQRFTVIAVSFLLTAVMYIPLILVSIYEGKSFLDIITERSRFIAVLLTVPLSAYLLFSASETGLRSHYYASSTLFDAAPSFYLFVFTAAALIFAVFKGIETVTRTGTVILALFGVLLTLMTIALIPELKPDRLYPAFTDNSDTFMTEVMREFSRNSEAVVFSLLCGRVRKNARRTIPLYLGVSAALLLFMTFLYNAVFGRYLSILEYPFYTLASVSDIAVIHRINALDVIVWIMVSVIKLTGFSLAFGEAVLSCFRSEKAARLSACIFSIAAVGISWLFTLFPELTEIPGALCETGAPLVFFAVIAPSAALIARPVQNKKEAGKCTEE